MQRITILALSIRILVALFNNTFFQPDEYFQALEPAHHIVFGYGHLTWEWLTPQPIRSVLYPALNVPIYWVLKITKLDTAGAWGDWLLISGPRILHGALAAATDIWVSEIARKALGVEYASTALFLSLTSFFHVLSLSRSLSNSLETSLTTIAFSTYPWHTGAAMNNSTRRRGIRRTIIFAALACTIRPTNAVVWVFPFGLLAWRLRSQKRVLLSITADGVVVGSLALLALFIVDSLYYRQPILTPLNFLRINMSSVSLFYGSSPWHFYLTQAVPILCTTALPFTLHGMCSVLFYQSKNVEDKTGDSTSFKLSENSRQALKTILGVLVWTIAIYSMAGHKEWRFLHPILPLLHIFAAKSIVDLHERSVTRELSGTRHSSQASSVTAGLPIRRSHFLFLGATLPLSFYVMLSFSSAPISVMSYLRTLPPNELSQGGVGVLMPCHSLPGQAYLHRGEEAHRRIWALGCEPPLREQDLSEYKDQTDVFFQSPLNYLQDRFPSSVDPSFPLSPFPTSIPGTELNMSWPEHNPGIGHHSNDTLFESYPWKHNWPKYLIFFGALLQEEGVENLFLGRGYQPIWRNGREYEGEGKRRGGIRVWEYMEKP